MKNVCFPFKNANGNCVTVDQKGDKMKTKGLKRDKEFHGISKYDSKT